MKRQQTLWVTDCTWQTKERHSQEGAQVKGLGNGLDLPRIERKLCWKISGKVRRKSGKEKWKPFGDHRDD